MKRRRLLITGVLLLLGGAIVNVAVAWGCLKLEVHNGLKTRIIGEWVFHGSLETRASFAIEAAGWPLRAIECHDNAFAGTSLWPGFAINTIFYAAMLWVVFFVPGVVRRRIRRRRGLCPACAYPIGSSPVCTECGKPVTRAS